MNYTAVANPRWTNAEHTAIDIEVMFEDLGEVTFTASPADCMDYGRELFERAAHGDFGPVA